MILAAGLGLAVLGLAAARAQEAAPAAAPLPEGAVARLGTAGTRHGMRFSTIAALPGERAGLIAFGADATVRTIDPRARRVEPRASGLTGRVAGPAAFAGDGSALAVAIAGGEVQVVPLRDGARARTLRAEDTEAFTAIAVSHGAELVAAASIEGITLFGAGGRALRLPGHADIVLGLAFTRDASLLVSCGQDGTIRIFDAATGKALRAIEAGDAVQAIAPFPDGTAVAAGLANGAVATFELATGKPRGRLAAAGGEPCTAVAFSREGRQVATGARDGTVRLLDGASGAELRSLRPFREEVVALALGGGDASEAPWLAALGAGESLVVVERTTGREVARHDGREAAVLSLAWATDGKRVAAGTARGEVRLFDLSGGAGAAAERARRTQERPVSALGFDASGNAGARDRPAAAGAAGVYAASGDGALVATAGADGYVEVRDAATGKAVQTLPGRGLALTALALSPDRTRLAAASVDARRSVVLWDLGAPGAPEELRVLRGHLTHEDGTLATPAHTLAFSPDGKLLASGGVDRTVRLWSVETGQPLATLRGHADQVNAVAFAPDGKTLASGSSDATVLLWDVGAAAGKHR